MFIAQKDLNFRLCNSVGQLNMRLDISGQFVVNVVTPNGGWSKGRPIAFIENGDTWHTVDLLIPNDLSDAMLESFIAHKFSGFAVAGKPIRRLDEPSPARGDVVSAAPRTDAIIAGGGNYVFGYLVATSMMASLWLALYGPALKALRVGIGLKVQFENGPNNDRTAAARKTCNAVSVVYRLRFKTPDPLSLIRRTVWLDPCTTMSITPEIEYSLL